MFVAKFEPLMYLTRIIDFIINISQSYDWNDRPDVILIYNFSQAEIRQANFLINDRFPDNFYFGVATSAYECEGAWNITDKGESVWDHMTHLIPSLISDQSNGDISSDFYHMYAKDVQLARSIGATTMKISLSWTRILPDSYDNHVSQSGILFYDKVINEMLINGITPMVSLFDGDMPYCLQQLGGWANPIMVNIFADYAKIAFASFGDRVKHWATINDPVKMCRYGYGGTDIPAVNMPGIADYLCGHHVLLAHAKVYELYHQEYNPQEDGKLGILNYYTWFVPERNFSELDKTAAERAHKFYNDWFTHPIFSRTGDYPDAMRARIDHISQLQNFPLSRLPTFSPAEIEQVKGSADFLGIDYYVATSVEDYTRNKEIVLFDKDAGIRRLEGNRWTGEKEIKNTPWGLIKLLHRLRDDYSLPELWITGNGYADSGGDMDWSRMVYHHEHLNAILKAMRDGINIQGYLIKTLVDGFEEMNGYETKFGLYQIDVNDSARTRSPKLSANIIGDVFKKKAIRPLEEMIFEIFKEKFYIDYIVKIVVQFQQWTSVSHPSF